MILISATDVIDFAQTEERATEKLSKRKVVKGHFRRISLLILNFLFNYDKVFEAIGRLNRKYQFINTVFVAYPATEEYALAYVYKRHRDIMRWLPWPAGIFRQNGKWGVMFVISSTDGDFINPNNLENLRLLERRTEHIRKLFRADQKTFAGILPGVMFAKRILRKTVETETTVEAVLKAEKGLKDYLGYPKNCPLIILGGKGFVGRRLMKRFAGRDVYSVDLKDNRTNGSLWPDNLSGQPIILINVTKKAAISDYVEKFWPQLVVLNETYPEPSEEEIAIMAKIGVRAYHVSGVKARSFPKFPRAYGGGIPCCASWNSPDTEVIVKELNGVPAKDSFDHFVVSFSTKVNSERMELNVR